MPTVEVDPGSRSEQLWQVARVDGLVGQRTALYVPVPRVDGSPQVAWMNKRSPGLVSFSWARYHTREIARVFGFRSYCTVTCLRGGGAGDDFKMRSREDRRCDPRCHPSRARLAAPILLGRGNEVLPRKLTSRPGSQRGDRVSKSGV
ncbi:hypothetical protein Bbelb_023230 [Branchiostoma belcheri]|nr:hypothetical protein Bbelb_023230 [Branchiostoma belcheri]